MTVEAAWPGIGWENGEVQELGFDRVRLSAAAGYLAKEAGGRPYRVLVVRHGRVVAEWNYRVNPLERRSIGAAGDAVTSCLLGIAISEGVVRSEADRVTKYYPELAEAVAGRATGVGDAGLVPDPAVTFDDALNGPPGSPGSEGEGPGAFKSQRCAISVVQHALASAYRLYQTRDPGRGGGLGLLAEWRIRDRIGAGWQWEYTHLGLPATAPAGVIGYHTEFLMTAYDMARLGLLWLRGGTWRDQQVIPSAWMDKVVNGQTTGGPEAASGLRLGFWRGRSDRLLPHEPQGCFSAVGESAQQVWVCPALDLVVAQNPGLDEAGSAALHELIVEAVRG